MIRIVTVFLFFLLVNFSFSFDTSDQHEKEVNIVFKNKFVKGWAAITNKSVIDEKRVVMCK